MNITVALTGASGAFFGRELLCALKTDKAESLTATSGRPAMRAVGAMFVSPALQRGVEIAIV
jgi:3-polyprenyl-4-hydroxybenzoate decarboxylase